MPIEDVEESVGGSAEEAFTHSGVRSSSGSSSGSSCGSGSSGSGGSGGGGGSGGSGGSGGGDGEDSAAVPAGRRGSFAGGQQQQQQHGKGSALPSTSGVAKTPGAGTEPPPLKKARERTAAAWAEAAQIVFAFTPN